MESDPISLKPVAKAVVKCNDPCVSSSSESTKRKRSHDDLNDTHDRKVRSRVLSPASFPVSYISYVQQIQCQQDSHCGGSPVRSLSSRGQLKDDSLQCPSHPSSHLTEGGTSNIMMIGRDAMVHILTFLKPTEVLHVLTMPLCKAWKRTFTTEDELWRMLCSSAPFKAPVDSYASDSDDDSSICSFSTSSVSPERPGKARVLYTSFIRCLLYLNQISNSAAAGSSGEQPSTVDRRNNANVSSEIVQGNESEREVANILQPSEDAAQSPRVVEQPQRKLSQKRPPKGKKAKAPEGKFSRCILTQRLLGPGVATNVASSTADLPLSCAIYSILNFMIVFSNVEGIQINCLQVLPNLLEDERNRSAARQAGLINAVTDGMAKFPDSVELHEASLHTLVLLTRPLGGREGMLLSGHVVNGIQRPFGMFGYSAAAAEKCISAILGSMRRFIDNEALQAMGCWSMVNIGLASEQREILIQLGAFGVIANTMTQFPLNSEVQVRALFSLVNLVNPSYQNEAIENGNNANQSMLREGPGSEMMGRIIQLVVVAMKNFCFSEAILTKSCLVLHNISLANEYKTLMIQTPHCSQMLEWCTFFNGDARDLKRRSSKILRRLRGTDHVRDVVDASIEALDEAHRQAASLQENNSR